MMKVMSEKWTQNREERETEKKERNRAERLTQGLPSSSQNGEAVKERFKKRPKFCDG